MTSAWAGAGSVNQDGVGAPMASSARLSGPYSGLAIHNHTSGVRDVRQHGGHEHGRPIGPYHAVPAVQQEREPERAEQAQGHGDDHEHEGVAQRDAEHVVADQLAERVEPDPLRGADEVPLEE